MVAYIYIFFEKFAFLYVNKKTSSGLGSLICVPSTVWLMASHTKSHENDLQNASQLWDVDLNNNVTDRDHLNKSVLRRNPGNPDRFFLCWIHFLVRLYRAPL